MPLSSAHEEDAIPYTLPICLPRTTYPPWPFQLCLRLLAKFSSYGIRYPVMSSDRCSKFSISAFSAFTSYGSG